QLTTPNIPGLEGRPFGDELKVRLGTAVTLENDINLAAVGEHWAGVAQGVDDFAFLSVGTGMGMGLVLAGELHRGKHGAAGEVDWALAGLGDEVDPSAEGVAALAARLASDRSIRTSLVPPYDARDIFAAARSAGRRPSLRARQRVRQPAARDGLDGYRHRLRLCRCLQLDLGRLATA